MKQTKKKCFHGILVGKAFFNWTTIYKHWNNLYIYINKKKKKSNYSNKYIHITTSISSLSNKSCWQTSSSIQFSSILFFVCILNSLNKFINLCTNQNQKNILRVLISFYLQFSTNRNKNQNAIRLQLFYSILKDTEPTMSCAEVYIYIFIYMLQPKVKVLARWIVQISKPS